MTIHVVLVDAGDGEVLGQVDLPAEQLPETFAVSTTLHLGDDEWQVERAEPVTRAEYAASGQLRLWLRRLARVDPREILFSLPTLETLAPPLTPATGPAAWMHEDDWRQRELVSPRFADEVAAELADIRAVLTHHRRGPGFERLHVRERIPEPLAGLAITVADLALPGPLRSLALGASGDTRPLVVVGGFLDEDSGVYGRTDGLRVVALGLRRDLVPPSLVALARAHRLLCVDWLAATLVELP